MATLNKITVASEMFMEARVRFLKASCDIDYVVSIMMSGSVIGMVGPLLTEQGGYTSHSILVRISNRIGSPGSPPSKEGMFRAVYNGLKHAGDRVRKVDPSSDLFIEADLKHEAAHLLDDAQSDFRQIKITQETRQWLSPEFLKVLELNESYL